MISWCCRDDNCCCSFKIANRRWIAAARLAAEIEAAAYGHTPSTESAAANQAGSPLHEGPLQLVGDRLEQITQHGAATGLHEDFGRHAGD